MTRDNTMDQKQIEEIVRSVMASMGQDVPQPVAPSTQEGAKPQCAAPTVTESCALDLGSAEAKARIGVENPHRADVLTELRRSTAARVCTGRAGRVRAPVRCCASRRITPVRKTPCSKKCRKSGAKRKGCWKYVRRSATKPVPDAPGYGASPEPGSH